MLHIVAYEILRLVMNSTKWIAIFFVSLPVGAVDLSDIRSDIMVNGSSNGISSSSFLKDLKDLYVS